MTSKVKFKLEYFWLLIGMIALLFATSLAILLVSAKTPLLSHWFGNTSSFQSALVLHVNLNIILWIGSVASYFWSKSLPKSSVILSLTLATIGLFLWLFSYTSSAQPLLNNYIPVYADTAYFIGLILIQGAFLITSLHWIIANKHHHLSPGSNIHWTKMCLAMFMILSIFITLIALAKLGLQPPSAAYFEQLFWGSGHIQQLFSLQLMMTIWVSMSKKPLSGFRFDRIIWFIPFIAILSALAIALFYHPGSQEYRYLFTQHMRFFGFWILPIIAFSVPWRSRLASDRLIQFSSLLFIFGAAIGMMIRNDNLMVPAHYHAITGAINLSIMGLILLTLVPSYNSPKETLIKLPMKFYAASVFMLAGGLAWSGTLGGVRKVTLAAQTIQDWQHYAVLGLMGVGGILAALTVFLFLGISLLHLGKKSHFFNNSTPRELIH